MKEEQPNYHVLETNKLVYAMRHCDFETIKTITIDISDDYDRHLRKATQTTTEILAWCFERDVKVSNPAYVVSDCAEHGKPECLDYLARKGFDLNEKQDDGDYPLYTAAIAGRADNIQVLINHGVEPNDQKSLLGAINNGHLEATKTLLENGADPTANNDNALYQAISWGHDEIISYLIVERKMPVRPETREWLNRENPEHVGVILAKQLIEKRDLFEKLNQKQTRATPTTNKDKSQSFKHKI
ncbi:ankyrin repeat domain-containing protein [Serratia marcescens]|uniref:ankyrin repeat domain-containing protein n=1 Tax=Serratia marcescens TaxID=615 RepID=UPI001F150E02|nr:ankyrin repeat domain-containing protein [Serratia marcescens]